MTSRGGLADPTARCQYGAYGVELDCDFALPAWPAIRTRRSTARTIAATAVGPGPVAALWSGGYRRLHEARVADGAWLTVERGREDDHLIGYGEHRFHLTADGGLLSCALDDADPRRWHGLLDWATYAAAVLTGIHCLHAAAVRLDGIGLVAIAAPAGGGKTALAAQMVAAGGAFFSDDVLALGREGAQVIGHPGPPFATVDRSRPDPAGRLGIGRAELGPELWVEVGQAAAEPEPVAAVVLLDRGADRPGRPCFEPESPVMLRGLVAGFEGTGEEERFALLTALAAQAPPLRLSAADSVPAAILAAMVRSKLEGEPRR